MQTDEGFAAKANLYMAQEKNPSAPYAGETEVLHYLELLRDKVGFDKIKAAVTNPLKGRRVAAYYGCLLLRPGKVMAFDDPENPSIMENFIRALGAEPVIYPARNECCGGYIAMEDAASAQKRSNAVAQSAVNHGADCIVTACPLCKYNLEKHNKELPVVYLTELLAEALGVKEDGDGN
jgi:heterodisulfide reductase subunit B